MAHDKTKQIEIRAFYESHNLSYVKVAEHFVTTGYEISAKTIEGWGSKEKWVKNRYSSLSDALNNLLDNKVIDLIPEEAKTLIKDKISKENGVLEPDVLDAMAETISTELTYQILNKRALSKEIALNLSNSKIFATNSKSIQANAIYHDMLIKTFGILNGKDEKMPLPNPNTEIKLSKPLSEMTLEELNALEDENG
ncbi:MAG: Unknown protein [uncultured Sulfurovum sp.]|uniref:Phage terminase small subunit n=1 Tax=uncultured Sulfurovum sp. TaxID=269237 RepID=A0A6S6SE10_9BACT|nr:MAG: Unknown protein [uncultured Sulfurovum sp.]